jgi:hypothetical protein
MEITGATAIIGFVNGISLLLDKQYKSFAKFAIAVVVGAVLGHLHYFGIDGVEAGIGIALSSSGIYKIAQLALTSSK